MASKIHILSDQTINQIAAGEVIENPASVIKELTENAIDAGASHLRIEVLAGGFQRIKVSDNGSGMSPDDAILSLERHATSKIISAEDLFSLATMGFRGEALASIASISKLTLTTALENATALTVEVEGGKVVHAGPTARERGTTIEVRSLFFNVPARKKFQKSAAASQAEITKTVTQLALAHPEIGIDLYQRECLIFSLPTSQGEDFLTSLKSRVAVLLNDGFLASSHPLQFRENEYSGAGFIASPLFSRHNRSGQYLFVNRRPVICSPVSYAIRDAYGTRLASDRHPVYVLHLSIPAALVDVNVHPQKKEIRLKEEGLLKQALHQAINEALSHESFVDIAPFVPSFSEGPIIQNGFRTAADFAAPLEFKAEESGVEESDESFLPHELNVLGFYGRYLLVEAQSLPPSLIFRENAQPMGVVWCDLSAIEARLQFDALMRHKKDHFLSQGLLIPETLSFSYPDAEILHAHMSLVLKLGLEMRCIGKCVFLLEAVPPFVEEMGARKVLEELIGELHGLEQEKAKDPEKLRHLAATISQRVRLRKKSYSLKEAQKLVEMLVHSSDPFHCPHGRLTFCHIKEEEIENYFKAQKIDS